jgi:hypothetical protein
MTEAADRRPKASHKPFQPAIRTRFVVSEVPAIEARTRGFLARGLAIFVGAVVASTGAYGLATGNFVPLETVWAVGGPFIGAIVAYYFGPYRKDSG